LLDVDAVIEFSGSGSGAVLSHAAQSLQEHYPVSRLWSSGNTTCIHNYGKYRQKLQQPRESNRHTKIPMVNGLGQKVKQQTGRNSRGTSAGVRVH
jgi:hypothetical protein